MDYSVYILYSAALNIYYTGHARNVEGRLTRHLSDHSGFTTRAKDWQIFYTKSALTKSEAIQLEKKIKKRGARRFLDDLK
jgi:putative endonuclease